MYVGECESHCQTNYKFYQFNVISKLQFILSQDMVKFTALYVNEPNCKAVRSAFEVNFSYNIYNQVKSKIHIVSHDSWRKRKVKVLVLGT